MNREIIIGSLVWVWVWVLVWIATFLASLLLVEVFKFVGYKIDKLKFLINPSKFVARRSSISALIVFTRLYLWSLKTGKKNTIIHKRVGAFYQYDIFQKNTNKKILSTKNLLNPEEMLESSKAYSKLTRNTFSGFLPSEELVKEFYACPLNNQDIRKEKIRMLYAFFGKKVPN